MGSERKINQNQKYNNNKNAIRLITCFFNLLNRDETVYLNVRIFISCRFFLQLGAVI